MLNNYRHVWRLLDRSERVSFAGLVAMSIFMALLEMSGVAAIFPFLKVVGDPSIIESNGLFSRLNDALGTPEPRQFTLIFGVLVLTVLVAGMSLRALGSYLQTRFAMMRGRSISRRILANYLKQEYLWHLQRNTNGLSQTLLSEVDLVVQQAILPAIMLLTNATVAALIVGLLFVAQPWIALGAVLVLGLVYGIVLLLLRAPLQRAGRDRVQHNERRFDTISGIGGAIKEIKVLGYERTVLSGFRPSALGMARAHTNAIVLGQLPKFALEAVIYGGFVALILFSFVSGGGMAQLMPLFGLFGMASLKLFPALQQIFADISLMRFSSDALVRLVKSVEEQERVSKQPRDNKQSLGHSIELKGVTFRFPQSDQPAINQLDATIAAKSTVGIVGGTGAGKSTLVDIIMGLLPATSGQILVDGLPMNYLDLRMSVGYVPQQIFLSDDTLLANIAFGVPADQIDLPAVTQAAKAANLHDFIVTDLPEAYQTMIGEGGVRLSGGQRQRIGIARALYSDPDILIFDEATSALDSVTEAAVMGAINGLAGQKTVIMIAHRLETVKNCDQIIQLEKGKICASGTFAELMQSSDGFKRLVNG